MPESVALRFTPPASEDLETLEIYESANELGPYVKIDETLEIGSFPDWIDNFTTDMATAENYWFSIQWIDTEGAESGLSAAIQGGTSKLIADVINRVKQRNPNLSEAAIAQEAEGAIEGYFSKDPYAVDESEITPMTMKYRILNGLTYLILGRSIIVDDLMGGVLNADSVTLGMVSMKQSSGVAAKKRDVEKLFDRANELLGINTSVILQLEEITVGAKKLIEYDQSRLMVWLAIR